MSRCIRTIGPLVALALVVGGASALLPAASSAQVSRPDRLPAATARIELDGPRFGVTALSSGIRAKLAERDIEVAGAVTQFGWQFERQFIGLDDGEAAISPVTELVLLVGGLEQGVLLPSVSWLVGLRSARGTEVGVGPNLTPAGAALAIAAGITIRQRSVNIPVNVAVVPSQSGVRVSLLTGWTMR